MSKVDFGYVDVEEKEKQGMVNSVFSSVAGKYDVMNDFMSFGLHRLWKVAFISKIALKNGLDFLDLAGGSGDISIGIAKKARKLGLENIKITCSDINENMLQNAKDRVINENLSGKIGFNVIDAHEIPYEDNSFDYVTIAFGIRNVTDKPKALKEILRVLKPGGRFLCLEFSNVDQPVLSQIYKQYSFNVIPKVGKLVANDEASYQYLVESIQKFPTAGAFEEIIKMAGFQNTSHQKLTEGVVAIHSGWKI